MFDRFITFFARQAPHSIAIVTLSGQATYSEFDANINRFAAAIADLKLPRSGLIGVVIADPYIHWLVLLALGRLGVTSTSYLSAMRGMMEPLLRPDFVITDETAGESDAQRPPLHRVDAEWLNGVAQRAATPLPRPQIDPESFARISTSSGTTGMPKKFGTTWRMIEEILGQGAIIGAATNAVVRSLALIGPEFLPFPGMVSAWSSGGAVLFGPDNPVALAHALTRLQPTSLYMSPIQLKILVDSLPEGFMPLRDVWLTVSGSHTPRSVREQTRLRLTNNLVLIYGTTEVGMIAMRPDTATIHDDADVGWLSPWIDLQIVDDGDHPLPMGTFGKVRVRSTSGVRGYIDDADNAKYFRDGWFYPGDSGSLAADGRLRIEGRTDEVMNFGGAKFMPHTIEGAIMGCKGVVDAGLFTMPGKDGFEVPWIAIVRGEGFREEDVAKALMIPGLPPTTVVWSDRIPRTPTGKVHRDQLRAAAKDR